MISRRSVQCVWSTLLLCLLAAASPVWSATPVSVGELKSALKRYQSMESLEVPFKQIKSLTDLNLELRSEGRLTLTLPDRVLWEILKPQPTTVLLEQDKITLDSNGKKETFKPGDSNSTKDKQSFADLLNWLKLDAEAIAQNYTVSKTTDRTYTFAAKRPDSAVKSLEMELTKSGDVAELNFNESSGDKIKIQFGKPKITHKK